MKTAAVLILLSFWSFKMNAEVSSIVAQHCELLTSYVDRAEFEKAETYLGILDSLRSVNLREEDQAEILYHQAYFWLFRKGALKSFEQFNEAVLLYKTLGNKRKELLTEAYLCSNLYLLQRNEDAIEKGEWVIEQAKQEYPEATAIVYNIFAAIHGGTNGDFEKSVYYAHKSLVYFKKVKNFRRLISLYGILSANFNNQGNYKEALHRIDSASMFANKLGNNQQINFLKIRKARACFNSNKPKEAISLLHEAGDYYRKNGSEHLELSWVYGHLRSYYSEIEDHEKALKYHMLDDSLAELTRRKKSNEELNELMISYETEKKEKQIEMQELVIASQRSRVRQYLFGGISLFSLSALFFGIYYFTSKAKQQKKSQEESTLYQQKLLSNTVNTQEEERKRIAQDLHDGIGQQMSGLRMGFEALVEKTEMQSHPLSQKIETIIKDVSQEIRTLSHQMMPKALSELGITSAIQDMLDTTLENSKIEYTFEHSVDQLSIPPPLSVGIYRITQELLNNTIKHAEATKIDVTLYQLNKQIIMVFEDNGMGFSKSKSNGQGLIGIESRLQTIGGSIQFEIENGTIATVRINLTAHE